MPTKGYKTSEFYVVAGVITNLLGTNTVPAKWSAVISAVLAGVYAGYRSFLKANATPAAVVKVPVKVTADPTPPTGGA